MPKLTIGWASSVRRFVRSYLPIREETGEDREGGSYYYGRHTRGEIRFESCMHVIRNFLRDCFRLVADVNAIVVSSAAPTDG